MMPGCSSSESPSSRGDGCNTTLDRRCTPPILKLAGGRSSSSSQQQECKKSIRFDKFTSSSSSSSSHRLFHDASSTNTSGEGGVGGISSACSTQHSVSVQHSVATPKIRNTASAARRSSSSSSSKRGAFGGIGLWSSNLSTISSVSSTRLLSDTSSTVAATATRQEPRDIVGSQGSVDVAAVATSATAMGPPSLIMGPKEKSSSAAEKIVSFLSSAVRKGRDTSSSLSSSVTTGSWYLRKNDSSNDKITVLGLVRGPKHSITTTTNSSSSTRAAAAAATLVSQKLVSATRRMIILQSTNSRNKTLTTATEKEQRQDSSMPSSSSSSAARRLRGQSLDRSEREGEECEQKRQAVLAEDEEKSEKQPQGDSSSRLGLLQKMMSNSKDRFSMLASSCSSEAAAPATTAVNNKLHSSPRILEAVSEQPNGNAVRIRVSALRRSRSLDTGTTRRTSRRSNSSSRRRSRSSNRNSGRRSRSSSLFWSRESSSLQSDAAQAHADSLSPTRTRSNSSRSHGHRGRQEDTATTTTTRSNAQTNRSKLMGELQSLFNNSSSSTSEGRRGGSGRRFKTMANRWQSLSALTTTATTNTTTTTTHKNNNNHVRFSSSLSNMGRNGMRAVTCLTGRNKDNADTEVSDKAGGGAPGSHRGRGRSRGRSRSRSRTRSRTCGVESEELTNGCEVFLSSSLSSGRSRSTSLSNKTTKAPIRYKSLEASQRSNPTINRMTTRRQSKIKKKTNKRGEGGAHLADSLYDPAVLALANNMFSCSDCQTYNQDKIDTTTYDSNKATIMMRDMANKRAERAMQLVIRPPGMFENSHQGEENEGSMGSIQDHYRNTRQTVSMTDIHAQQQQQQVLDLFGSAADNIYQGVLSIAAYYECVHPDEGKVGGGNRTRSNNDNGNLSSYYSARGGVRARSGEVKYSNDGGVIRRRLQPCHTTSSSSTAGPLPSLQGGYSI